MKINISINIEANEYEVELPDNTKSFYFNAQSQEINLEFHDETSQTKDYNTSKNDEKEDDDVTVMDIIQGADSSVFAAAAYMAKNPIAEAKKIAKAKRNSSTWHRYKKIAHKTSCSIDFKDTDTCDNVHLRQLLDYYINNNDKVEEFLKEVGDAYGTTSRSIRLNYAAYEAIKKVRANGNSSFYSEEDLKRPIKERVLLNYSLLSTITTYPFHTKKLRWLDRIGKYILGKYLYGLLMDGKLPLLNDIPEQFTKTMVRMTGFIIDLEKRIGKDYEIAPEGLFRSTVQVYTRLLEQELRVYYPNLTLDSELADYNEYCKQIPNEYGIMKYKIPSTNYVRKDPYYRKLWSALKILPGVREYNVKTRDVYPKKSPL
ncbi:MAG: hypothetical protein R3321_00005 [Nitrososphaeraceae archaeon]|nr:hypothetical protein [Nitrososphaeraceae archaeon]